MDAINARELDQQRQRRGLQFQNVFLGWESWDVNGSPQSVPEHQYASKNPILGSSLLLRLDLSKVLTLDS
jgi:hypothetical protein